MTRARRTEFQSAEVLDAKMVAANRASKRRRTSSETQKFHGEPKEGYEEEHQGEDETVAMVTPCLLLSVCPTMLEETNRR